ncbi:epoxide hydrolase family protein [Stackebrandtia nassauensis]|uniref:Microsomal epoxide hydrolase n=1 Tax=Stackebrandtia nassauensis (strain DSM 44728 / CIP 108903 / NRRL B-16338 / NBRC 102104 / LLR-40K-21) TaxID=446470 RepID=D3Q889_STANL|nr:epoxide hydrolase family protein [Stackebrandtia nassauensis]ADD42463.1 Microsomal epoxide hydrolase [Stackebrandtia nassauensis DSM 44728]
MSNETAITPFTIDIPQSELDYVRERLTRTRFAQEIPGAGTDYGVPTERVQHLVDHWLNNYDWREWEAKLNAYPQFTTEIDGQNIHFLHVKSPEPDAIPLLLTHGWPGSVVEYLDVIDALSDPKAHGSDGPAFHLVIPSLPGFGFSGPTTDRGWGTVRTAKAMGELMNRLGYQRYGQHGNDGGSMIAPELGRQDPDAQIGVHVNQAFSFPSGDPSEMENLTEEEGQALQVLGMFWEEKGAFNVLHSQQPNTLAHALADSPVGLLGWNDQLMGAEVSDDFVITNVLIYWLTNTSGSSIRFYYEDKKNPPSTEPTTFPLGVSNHANDFQGIRRFVDRDHKNIVQWRFHDEGGHYSDHQIPEIAVADIRDFFGELASRSDKHSRKVQE